MSQELLIKVALFIVASFYTFFFILIAFVDGMVEALTWETIPARALNYLMGNQFWGPINLPSVFNEAENKLVGSQLIDRANFPIEASITFWGLFNTPEGKRELKLAIIRPLWPFVSMILFMGFICVIRILLGIE